MEDENIGKIFGCYKILEKAPSRKSGKISRSFYLCECIKCGNIREVNKYKVTHNNYQYCSECTREYNYENLVGQKFGRLTVLERTENKKQPNGSHKIRWKCKCDCGNLRIVPGCHLKDGHTTSCGCAQKEIVGTIRKQDLTGKQFGKLTVKKFAYMEKGQQFWECKCECGSTCFYNTCDLNSKKVNSCGCLRSVAEFELKNFLIEKGYTFIPQYTFPDCRCQKKLPFDFAIFNNDKLVLLVELQGMQHYYPFTFCNEDKKTKIKNLEELKIHDKIKYDYCKKNNINLLRIKYTRFNKKEKLFEEAYNKAINSNVLN